MTDTIHLPTILAVKTAVGPTILLQSGRYFDLLDPHGSDFTIEDIAHGLAHCCRFAGQCSRFYSVAEHCWHASYLVEPKLAMAALMHDAAEAFLGDVTRPLKQLLPAYKVIEEKVEDAIAVRFQISGMKHPDVKRADLALLAGEQAALMPTHADDWACLAGITPAQADFGRFPPEQAKAAFVGRYNQLRRGALAA